MTQRESNENKSVFYDDSHTQHVEGSVSLGCRLFKTLLMASTKSSLTIWVSPRRAKCSIISLLSSLYRDASRHRKGRLALCLRRHTSSNTSSHPQQNGESSCTTKLSIETLKTLIKHTVRRRTAAQRHRGTRSFHSLRNSIRCSLQGALQKKIKHQANCSFTASLLPLQSENTRIPRVLNGASLSAALAPILYSKYIIIQAVTLLLSFHIVSSNLAVDHSCGSISESNSGDHSHQPLTNASAIHGRIQKQIQAPHPQQKNISTGLAQDAACA